MAAAKIRAPDEAVSYFRGDMKELEPGRGLAQHWVHQPPSLEHLGSPGCVLSQKLTPRAKAPDQENRPVSQKDQGMSQSAICVVPCGWPSARASSTFGAVPVGPRNTAPTPSRTPEPGAAGVKSGTPTVKTKGSLLGDTGLLTCGRGRACRWHVPAGARQRENRNPAPTSLGPQEHASSPDDVCQTRCLPLSPTLKTST